MLAAPKPDAKPAGQMDCMWHRKALQWAIAKEEQPAKLQSAYEL
jgi:hypothetical protein